MAELRRTKNELLGRLRALGLSFSEFSLVQEGAYAAEDADWNYKDVPHLDCVHELVDAAIASVGDDQINSIIMQKMVGLRFPMALYNYQAGENTQVYYTTLFFFALVIETRWEEIAPLRTRVTTTYAIGSHKLWQFLFPVMRWMLKRNYANLMSGDVPMRDRRGQLRGWGYQFRKRLAYHSFRDTMNIAVENVVPPVDFGAAAAAPIEVAVERELPGDGTFFVGRDDHQGLRLVRAGNRLEAYPRMCPHEGASLDHSPCVNGQVRCPWHGRKFKPLATFDLSVPGEAQSAATAGRRYTLRDGVLRVERDEAVRS